MNKTLIHILYVHVCVVDPFFPLDKLLYIQLLGQKLRVFFGFFHTYCPNAFQKDCTTPHSLQQCMSADFPSPSPTLCIIILFNHCQSDQEKKNPILLGKRWRGRSLDKNIREGTLFLFYQQWVNSLKGEPMYH